MRLIEIRADPRPVAIARIGVGIATMLNAVEAWDILQRIAGGRLATPVIAGAPVPSDPLLTLLLVLSFGAALAVTVGWRTEAAAITSVACSVAFLVWDQQTYSSHRLLGTLIMSYLIFARSGTAWSIRPVSGRPAVRWWPQLLMMTQLSVCYLFSALSKMSFVFLSGIPLAQWVWIELPQQFFTLAAMGTVVVELVIAVGLWFRSTRRVAVVLGLGLHISIVTLMDHDNVALFAFALTCVSLYPLFLFRPAFRVTSRANVMSTHKKEVDA